MKAILAFAGLALFVALACAPSPVHGATPETLKLGVVAPLSGPGAPWGICLQTLLEIAVDEINGKGGLHVGNKTYNLKVIAYDDKYMPEAGLTATNRLVHEDGVKYIFGPNSSAGALAMQGVTEKEKVFIFTLAFTRRVLGPDKPFTFRWIPTPFEYAYPEASWMLKKYPQMQNVIIAAPNDETGRETIDANRGGFQEAGIKNVAPELFERGAPDMLPLATKILHSKPDLIDFDGAAPGDVANIAKVARSQGYKGLMSKLGGGGNICVAAAPEALEGFIFHTEADLEAGGKVGELVREMKKRRPENPVDSFVPDLYSVFGMLLSAMQSAGTVDDVNVVRLALEKINNYEGINGKYGWEGKETYGINHQLHTPLYLAEGVGGKTKILDRIR